MEIIGYLIVAFIVAKVGYIIHMKQLDRPDKVQKDNAKGTWGLVGLTWIFSIPLGLIFTFGMVCTYLLIEGSKKIL